ncbi:ATP synthase F1 subunit delta [bacterium]|nr:ATP synthase F1 subunit delta [bacterium]
MAEKLSLAAKRYSKALIELSMDGSIDNTMILNQLYFVQEVLNSSKELRDVLNMPQISTDIKKEILNKVYEPHIDKVVLNFLNVLLEQNRFKEFDEILASYKEELDKFKNINNVEVISAVELTDEQKDRLKNKLQEKLNCSIEANWGIDPAIMAGLVIKYDGNVIDMSLRNKLKDLNKNIVRI